MKIHFRRGPTNKIFRDCDPNFVNDEKIFGKLTSTKQNIILKNLILEEKIKWNFSPPGTLHNGELWEGTVKSRKQHLKKRKRTIQ